MERLIENEEYLAVFFAGKCSPGDKCYEMLENLENIDTDLQDYGIMMVMTEDKEVSRENENFFFPSLGLFRNGDFVKYSGDLLDEFDILEWITDRDTLEIPGKIEEVNEDMLDALLQEESDLVVFMYRDGNRIDDAYLYSMAELDVALDDKNIKMVSICSKGIEKQYGLFGLPLLLYFKNSIPKTYKDDLAEDATFTKFNAFLIVLCKFSKQKGTRICR